MSVDGGIGLMKSDVGPRPDKDLGSWIRPTSEIADRLAGVSQHVLKCSRPYFILLSIQDPSPLLDAFLDGLLSLIYHLLIVCRVVDERHPLCEVRAGRVILLFGTH